MRNFSRSSGLPAVVWKLTLAAGVSIAVGVMTFSPAQAQQEASDVLGRIRCRAR